jgi:hypothetical protein
MRPHLVQRAERRSRHIGRGVWALASGKANIEDSADRRR